MVKLFVLRKDDRMKKPELTDVGWLGPKDEMDRASHRFGKCSECPGRIWSVAGSTGSRIFRMFSPTRI
jgi:hypothetical protein